MNRTHLRSLAASVGLLAFSQGPQASAQFQAASSLAPPSYVVSELPGLGTEFNSTHVFDVNNAGQACGYAWDSQLRWRAVRWSPTGQVIDLGGASGAWSMALGISENGIVGGFHGATLQTAVPVIWVGANRIPLPDPSQGDGIEVWDVNDSLQAVGRGHNGVDSFATRWITGGCTQIGDPVSYAFAINASGTAAGFVTVAGNAAPARWDDGVLTVLPDLGIPPAKAVSVNARGTIVGGAASPITGLLHGIAWDGAVVIDLGLYQGIYLTTATGINDNGTVAGYYYLDPLAEIKRAVVWTESGDILDLNELDQAGSGWTLEEATEINASGWIVGHGARAGFSGTRGFVAKPR